MNNSQNIQTTLKKLLPFLKKLLPTLKSFLPALIVALAVMIGLLGGAKIISNGIVEANRFQFVETDETSARFFDSATGHVYKEGRKGWEPLFGHQSSLNTLKSLDVYSWVEYLEDTKWCIEDARKYYHD